MANKLGRGLSALFGDMRLGETETVDVLNSHKNKKEQKKSVIERNSSDGTLILPAKNEEAIEIANSIEQALGLPTSLVITRKGGKLSIQCKTYEELEMLVKKLTADE